MAIELRDAREEDGPALARLYAPYVASSVVTFELEAPDGVEMAARVARIQRTHFWIVAEEAGEILGYAYCGPFRSRPAYDWTGETAIYLDPERRGRGLGRQLYEEVLARMARLGLRLAIAGITLPNPESVGFHEALGFEAVGVFGDIGWKSDAWHDVGFWQKALGRGGASPPGPSPVSGR